MTQRSQFESMVKFDEIRENLRRRLCMAVHKKVAAAGPAADEPLRGRGVGGLLRRGRPLSNKK